MRHTSRLILASTLLPGVLACNVNTNAGSSFETEGETATAGTAGTAGTDGTGTSSGADTDSGGSATTGTGTTSGGSTGNTIFDLGAPDIVIDTECTKVDLLFVMDASGSMYPHHQQLLATYPAFMDGLSQYFEDGHDFHIGVTSTDTYEFNEPGCEDDVGALITQTGGFDSSNAVCTPFASGQRFMTQDDDLMDKFGCAAQVGTAADYTERPVRSAIWAVDGTNAACNDGFLRDDALLVIVMVSNAVSPYPDADTDPNVDDSWWFDALVATKGGHPENVAILGFLPVGDTFCIPNGWDGYQDAQVSGFIEKFGDNGVVANVCEADYAPIFDDFLSVVLNACTDFVPPG